MNLFRRLSIRGGGFIQAYFYIIKIRLLVSLAYRFDALTSTIANIIQVICSVILWRVIYHGSGTVAGVSEHQMVTYTIISFLLMPVLYCSVQDTINRRVRNGEIAIDVYRPVSILGSYLAQDIGESLSLFITRFIPSFIVVSIFLQIPAPSGILSGFLFIPSCILSYAILWLMSAIVSLSAFFAAEIGNMGMVKDIIIRLLAGSYVPLWFFPKIVQDISRYLPFQYTYQTPLGIYIGMADLNQSFFGMSVQAVWVLGLSVLLYFGWSRAKKSLLIQGG